jgi:hypothetical protein
MVSGLKINFWKSSLIGVNVSPEFLRVASAFLNCRVSSLPFKYLGLPVGASPRRVTTWEPLLESLRRRLGSWRNKFVSLGGRIVLLNAVLNAIPIFYLSFMKIPVSVWKKIRRIQRDFLWGCQGDRKKINWIKWDTICLPKNKGGLGVRDVRVVNISLLTKWRWRLLHEDNAVWKEGVKSKYGSGVVGSTVLGDENRPWFASLWWKDICSIGSNFSQNWFSQGVVRKLGNGVNTRFWRDTWVGEIPLQCKFPRLFSISTQKDLSVADMKSQNLAMEGWNLVWRRRLFEWEKAQLLELMEVINGVILLTNVEDKWGWKPEKGADFTVKSTYRAVAKLTEPETSLSHSQAYIFKMIWKCPAPSKVSGFIWQLLHGRIPTRYNLFLRRVLEADGDRNCVICGEAVETELHLFLYCEIAMLVWMKILSWLEVPFGLPHNIFSLFHSLMEGECNKVRKGMLMIGAAVIWSIWRCRNSILFDNGTGSVDDLVERIKVSSWKWWMRCSTEVNCLFYEWCAEPRLCLLR